jgi:hypothetical protein
LQESPGRLREVAKNVSGVDLLIKLRQTVGVEILLSRQAIFAHPLNWNPATGILDKCPIYQRSNQYVRRFK